MKKEKIFVLLFFILLNMGALYLISKIFTVSLGLLFCIFVVLLAFVDIGRRINNVRILNEKQKYQNRKSKENQIKQEELNKRRQQTMNKIKRTQRMREHNSYNSKGKRK